MPDDSRFVSGDADIDVERAVQNVVMLDELDTPAEEAADLTDEATDAQTDDEVFDESAEGPEDGANPLASAGNAAREAQHTIRAGIAAFKDVRAASRLHSSAREELRSIEETLKNHEDELRHRIDIEQRYDEIVAEQTAEREEAAQLAAEALQHAEELEEARADLESQLSIMKNRHEDELRPYRKLAESTKGRADDAARALADAKRQAKSAEGALSDATKRRDQRISAANRTVDNAQERLRSLQTELEALQKVESQCG